jgi:hypothetical protein
MLQDGVMRHLWRLASLGLVLTAANCSNVPLELELPAPTEVPEGDGPEPLFELPASLEALGEACSVDGFVNEDGECSSSFLDHPFPSDFRREGGKVRWTGFMNPRKMPPITAYTGVIDRLLDGFSPQAAGYVRFRGAIDPSTLPTSPQQTLEATAVAQLINVDDASPERGQRHPITLYYREKPGSYWPPYTLAFAPAFGMPLRPATRYAFVVTRGLKGAGGKELARSPGLDAALGLGTGGGAQGEALRASWAPAVAAVVAAGVQVEQIAHATVFTTNDPTAELFAIRDAVRASFPAPTARDWVAKATTATSYKIYEGMYGPSPDFQEGNLPFAKPADGGAFAFKDGTPQVQRQFDLRFAMAIPDAAKCPMPPEGYPIVLYAHGTTGDYRSFLADKTADALAQQCLASMGIDQIFHGTRPGAPQGPNADNEISLLFFNVDNPIAARTNGRQAAIDEVQRARLFTESKITIPASVSATGSEIRFDPSKVLFYGHSQGGQNGPLYLAIDDSARGGVLSGSGSILTITLLEKTKPTPSVAVAVRSIFLGLKQEEYEELNVWHPALSLAQSLVDTADPIHYVGHLIREPRPGFASKSIYQTEGVNPDGSGDNYTPPRTMEAQAVATGLPLMEPVVRPIPEMALRGLVPVTIPAEGLSGNLAGGKASGVLAQWSPTGSSDGHFVVFNVAKARSQAALFCRHLADDPVGRVPAP